MLNWFKGKQKIEGQFGYFGLADWWLSTFNDKEREYIERVYQPMGSQLDSRPLTQGTISYTSQTVTGLLSGLATWFTKSEDAYIAAKILEKAEETGQSNILDLHFAYQGMIQLYYRMRDAEPTALAKAIESCKKQIALASKTTKEFQREYPGSSLPAHVGYTQLAIILEKQKKYDEVLRLCRDAQAQGWNGDWEKRIERCQTKLNKIAHP